MRVAFTPLVLRLLAAAVAGTGLLVVSGCGSSSSGPAIPTIAPAKAFGLVGFRPAQPVPADKPTRLAFTIQQPSGQPLIHFHQGAGPHNGVHVIVVRDDLSVMIHRHPPVGADGQIVETLTSLRPGPYRVVIDAYPAVAAPQPNFQLFRSFMVAGAYAPKPLPPPRSTVTVDGFRFSLHGSPRLRAISPAFLKISVYGPNGKPATFTPWFGALAHAIFFRVGSLDYFHTHVCSPGATGCTSALGGAKVTGSSKTPGELTVGVLVPVSGIWRLFLQCRVDGHLVTAPFTLRVT
jgi:hypothetical protein